MGEIRIYAELKKGEEYSKIFDRIEKRLVKEFIRFDWSGFSDCCKRGTLYITDMCMEYEDLFEIVSEISRSMKGKGIIVADYHENIDAAVLFLGQEVRKIEVTDVQLYTLKINKTQKYLESCEDFVITTDEIKYYKKIIGVKLNIDPTEYEYIVTLDDNVGVMEFGVKNNKKAITGVDTIEGLELRIANMGFGECRKLKRVDLSKCKSVYIEDEAFLNCKALTEIVFPKDGDVKVCAGAFEESGIDIDSLTEIEII